MNRVRTLIMLLACAVLMGCGAISSKTPDSLAHDERMEWFREARYGMFVHYGPFSQWYDRNMAKTQSAQPPADATPEQKRRWSVERLTPPRTFARHWARTAKAAGMKYVVFTTKHHEGFVLWDTKLSDYNAMRMGPGFDMVAEFADACRSEGLKVGFYYSLLDGDHPDGRRCENDPAARRRFLDYTQGLLRELMTNYGRVDLLWYDGPTPLGYAGEWQSQEMNAMVRRLQPGIIINDRSLMAEDFTCFEGSIGGTMTPDQDWESCMQFNWTSESSYPTWTWFPTPPQNYRSGRDIIDMLQRCTAGTGNLLLNVGPNPATGQIGPVEQERMALVGEWLKTHGEAVFGRADRIEKLAKVTNDADGKWTRKGNVAYLWLPKWPSGGKVVLDNVQSDLLAASVLTNGARLDIQAIPQVDAKAGLNVSRVTLSGLAQECPDLICDYAVLKLEFASYPR
ncbi:MAG: alpha-L-fucosidase [Planctomycetaceae bacterium]|nr:alpha-L-fucosidase [Planctomycetaceae bacterium]